MLEDHEWRTLREVERHLAVEDPQFLQSFNDRSDGLRRRPARRALSATAVGAALLGVLMMVAGSPAGVVGFAAIAVLVWMVGRKL